MGEYLHSSKSTAYGNQCLKEKLLNRYGNSIVLTDSHIIVKNIVTFREKNRDILREYYNSPLGWDDEEAQKRAILQTAAKLIKADIKTTVVSMEDMCPTTEELKLAAGLDFIPASLRFGL